MIRNSFIFLDRVGERTERNLWRSGILEWDDFLSARSVPGFGTVRKGYCDRQILKAERNLLAGNAPHFAHILPPSEHWRLYRQFKGDAVFLDIETSGYYGDVTVVGLYDGEDTKILVKGINLNGKAIREELEKHKLIVTFNGSSFDLPVLERYYPGCIPFLPHLDLRWACQKIGYTGGLKKIEREMGIARPDELEDISGADAVSLWNAYRSSGKRKYLDKLVAYNEEDIINLQPITERVCSRLLQETLPQI